MALLSKKQILEAKDRSHKDVDVSEWGGTVRIGVMSAEQRDKYEMEFLKYRNGELPGSIRASLVAACAIDEEGAPLFTPADVVELSKKSGSAIGKLFDAATELNVLNKVSSEELKGNS